MKCKVMTYNIESCYDYAEKHSGSQPKLIAFLKREAPDVVVLNEVRDVEGSEHTIDQIGVLGRGLGWNYRFAKAIDLPGGIYGNAILSRHPIRAFSVTPIPLQPLQPGEENKGYREARCVLRAEIDIDGEVLAVYGSHFGLTEPEQRYAVEIVSALLDAETLPCVFMGDLNMQPDNPILAPIFARLGDASAVMPHQKLSFPSDAPNCKIDYIFVSDAVRVSDADIPDTVISDHRPHWAEIEY